MNPLQQPSRRICIIKPSSLGDVIQALPVLAALRAAFPLADISWVVNRSYASLLRPIPHLDHVVEFDRQRFTARGWREWPAAAGFLRGLRKQRYDLVIDLQGLLRSGLMTLATGAAVRLGLRSAREGAAACYTSRVDDLPTEQNAVERYWRVIEWLGLGDLSRDYPIAITESESRWASYALVGLPRPILALNPGARWETKRWPADRFAETAERALGNRSGSVVVLGGPGEELIANQVASGLRMPATNLCGKTSLRQLAAVLAQCDLLLTNDSGPLHLAAAVRTPTVSLFTCTSPTRAAPQGADHRAVQTCVACRSSYLKTCSRMDCMKDLTVERVSSAVALGLRRVPALAPRHDKRAA